jgi:hypothetical protein
MKKIVIIILSLILAGNSIVFPQLKIDPGDRMYPLYLKHSFARIDSTGAYNMPVSFIPVYINNLTDYDLTDSAVIGSFNDYCVFPKEIKARSCAVGYVYYLFTHANRNSKGRIGNKYNFNNSYKTPFIFNLLTENPKPREQSEHNGLGKVLQY